MNELLGVWIVVGQHVHLLSCLLLSLESTEILVKALIPTKAVPIYIT